jgi:hypothetical protein
MTKIMGLWIWPILHKLVHIWLNLTLCLGMPTFFYFCYLAIRQFFVAVAIAAVFECVELQFYILCGTGFFQQQVGL